MPIDGVGPILLTWTKGPIRQNEKLAAARANLENLPTQNYTRDVAALLDTAVYLIVPDIAPETILWITPMLLDLAHSAECRSDADLAISLRRAAHTLTDALDD